MKVFGTITSIYSWFAKARPRTSVKSFHTQMGVHFEEVAEMLQEITGLDEHTTTLLNRAEAANHFLAEHLKSNSNIIMIKPENFQRYLDAICDQIVTATGCAYDCKFNLGGAMEEVDRSNYSKFVNGEAIFDENGKIAKGPDYFKADLSPFV